MAFPDKKKIKKKGWFFTREVVVPDGWISFGELPDKDGHYVNVGFRTEYRYQKALCPKCRAFMHSGKNLSDNKVFWFCPRCEFVSEPYSY